MTPTPPARSEARTEGETISLTTASTNDVTPWPVIRLECIKSLGYAMMYMEYLHPDVNFEGQREAVEGLCEELHRNRNLDCQAYWQHFKEVIDNEIENMC